MFKNILLLIFSVSLFACTSAQIQHAVNSDNWQAVGQYDGENGLHEKSLSELQKLSVEFARGAVDYAAYQAGYEQALQLYCQPKNAFIYGVKRQSYPYACDRYPHGWAFYQDWLSGRHSRAGSIF
ncbi:DUF2799 domain-containing protein [Psychromonas aquimarina]|uniref:DUF2799 domain-containing protein n=1 Tax=Psychromonas aquimarina TaxID=444919 RepID=UPI0003FEC0F8|nr:DUF2799 domain-containing protein [Psychromonas aquimarina]